MLLQEPYLLFVDEATSVLDIATEKRRYPTQLRQWPECTLVSVTHNRALLSFSLACPGVGFGRWRHGDNHTAARTAPADKSAARS
ncbi:hypothetical protein AL051_25545 [Pseudomonas amygdali pv. dendropanacis]|nr:hypothetical protein AL051_25545 [Pseudomonas amygdali pv. dendropanacis]